mmetsp:Transcript_30097/g.89498  ORF Transcript_30097/g.89498 Transcript_30097/m.89498 type:complete len:265 (-) Transcript_30097:1815-2609(-)
MGWITHSLTAAAAVSSRSPPPHPWPYPRGSTPRASPWTRRAHSSPWPEGRPPRQWESATPSPTPSILSRSIRSRIVPIRSRSPPGTGSSPWRRRHKTRRSEHERRRSSSTSQRSTVRSCWTIPRTIRRIPLRPSISTTTLWRSSIRSPPGSNWTTASSSAWAPRRWRSCSPPPRNRNSPVPIDTFRARTRQCRSSIPPVTVWKRRDEVPSIAPSPTPERLVRNPIRVSIFRARTIPCRRRTWRDIDWSRRGSNTERRSVPIPRR